MCTILLSWNSNPRYKLIVAANRDEFHQRETKAAHWWEDHPTILGGRDMKAGGTWMGINRQGRFAALTNFRKFPPESFSTSRGEVVSTFLKGDLRPDEFLSHLHETGSNFDGFNILFGDRDSLFYFSNRGPSGELKPGIYGLSNHLLDTPWPKVSRGKEAFSGIVSGAVPDKEKIFSLLADRQRAEDHLLPDTGIGLERERILSSIFIESPGYGTRLSTVLMKDYSGNVDFEERSFIPEDRRSFTFPVEK